MIDPEEIKKGFQKELLSMMKSILTVLEILLIIIFLQDKRFAFEEIIVLLIGVLIISFLETKTYKVKYFLMRKNVFLIMKEFKSYLTIDTITYKTKEETKNKVEELLKRYPTTLKYKVEYEINMYIYSILEILLERLQNGNIDMAKVSKVIEEYKEYTDDEYVENVRLADEFCETKKHYFQEEKEINKKIKLEKEEYCTFMQTNVSVQRFSKTISKNACVFYTNKYLIIADENDEIIFKIKMKEVEDSISISTDENSYIFGIKDEYIVNLKEKVKRIQLNEIVEHFKNEEND